jgi:hypothetical protein
MICDDLSWVYTRMDAVYKEKVARERRYGEVIAENIMLKV